MKAERSAVKVSAEGTVHASLQAVSEVGSINLNDRVYVTVNRLFFCTGQNPTMHACWYDRFGAEAGVMQPCLIFFCTVGTALGQREQRGGVEGDRQGAIKLII